MSGTHFIGVEAETWESTHHRRAPADVHWALAQGAAAHEDILPQAGSLSHFREEAGEGGCPPTFVPHTPFTVSSELPDPPATVGPLAAP